MHPPYGLTRGHTDGHRTDPLVLAGGHPTPASDIFAFGIVLAELFGQQLPFLHAVAEGDARTEEFVRQGLVTDDLLRRITEEDLRPALPPGLPDWLKDVARDCWCVIDSSRALHWFGTRNFARSFSLLVGWMRC